MNKPTFLSLFSGIGGFDLGLHKAGWRCVTQIEINPFCRKVLGRHWPDVVRAEDVGDFSGRAAVDLLCAGSPCQDFSVAGGREGLAGAKSGLFAEFLRLAGELSPHWLLFENVRGILSACGGRDFGAILGALEERGYWWAYRVLNSRYFGVAQSRRRLYLVGHRGGPVPPAVLFERGTGSASALAGAHAPQEAPAYIRAGVDPCSKRLDLLAERPASIEACVPGARAHADLSDNFVIDHGMVKRLSPTECERAQGFPDGWTCLCGCEPYGSDMCVCPDTPRYKALGNAVTVPVAEWLGRRLLAHV